MHATQVLNTHLFKKCQAIHKTRWEALMSAVSALIQGKKLTVTGLGRSMPGESEESHRLEDYANPYVEKRFLKKMKAILPTSCCPLIVTDAGFRTPWFRSVQSLGWDFVGRIGGHMMARLPGEAQWVRTETLLATATGHARYVGNIDLVRNRPLACHAYLLKKKKQGRIKKTKFGQRCASKHSEKLAARYFANP